MCVCGVVRTGGMDGSRGAMNSSMNTHEGRWWVHVAALLAAMGSGECLHAVHTNTPPRVAH